MADVDHEGRSILSGQESIPTLLSELGLTYPQYRVSSVLGRRPTAVVLRVYPKLNTGGA